MTRFSDLYGYTQPRQVMQLDSIDDELRNGLWSVFYEEVCLQGGRPGSSNSSTFKRFLKELWRKYFRQPTDTIPEDWSQTKKKLRDEFYNFDVPALYNFIEVVAQNLIKPERFMEQTNAILKQEMAAYSFVDDRIIRLTDEQQIDSIKSALLPTQYEGVAIHFKRSLDLLSDKIEPDYRNSIKESISAIESLSKGLIGSDSKTLRPALDLLKRKAGVSIHPKLIEAYKNLYDWTSDADGIRHGMMDNKQVTFEDALYMLVICTAFANYVQTKAAIEPTQ